MRKGFSRLLLVCLILALGLSVVGCSPKKNDVNVGLEQDDIQGEGIDHHDIPYEWSGIFEFGEGVHTIKFKKNEGDESILVAFISTESNISDMEHHAAHVMEAEAIDVEKDGKFIAENEYTYNLDLKKELAEFQFEIESPGRYYVFTEHLPSEFQMEVLNPEGEVLKIDSPTEYEGDHDHH